MKRAFVVWALLAALFAAIRPASSALFSTSRTFTARVAPPLARCRWSRTKGVIALPRMPSCCAIASAVTAWSPVIMRTWIPAWCALAIESRASARGAE